MLIENDLFLERARHYRLDLSQLYLTGIVQEGVLHNSSCYLTPVSAAGTLVDMSRVNSVCDTCLRYFKGATLDSAKMVDGAMYMGSINMLISAEVNLLTMGRIKSYQHAKMSLDILNNLASQYKTGYLKFADPRVVNFKAVVDELYAQARRTLRAWAKTQRQAITEKTPECHSGRRPFWLVDLNTYLAEAQMELLMMAYQISDELYHVPDGVREYFLTEGRIRHEALCIPSDTDAIIHGATKLFGDETTLSSALTLSRLL